MFTSNNTQVVEIQKMTLLRCINHFKLDLINNMDHMRIISTEPSFVILSHTKKFKKLKSDTPKIDKIFVAFKNVRMSHFQIRDNDLVFSELHELTLTRIS